MKDLIVAIFVAFCMLAVAACGGPPREARVALEHTAGGLNVADELVADAIETRGEESRSQVRSEVHTGLIAGDTREETITAGLHRFDELMQPMTTARRVLHTVRQSLLAVEAGLDSWAAGADDGQGFLSSAACAVVSLGALVRALEAASVEIPAAIVSGLDLISNFASGACPEPEGS